jgi:hypothetical protein
LTADQDPCLDRYGLDSQPAILITERLKEIQRRIDEVPKSGKWKWRSRVGERKPWYSEPEEEVMWAQAIWATD